VTLTLSSGQEMTDPSDDELREGLAALDVEGDGEGFAILARSDLTYVQVSGDQSIGFYMEYQEGGTDRHFRAVREDFSLDEVVATFADYRDGGLEWWRGKDWEQISL